MELISKQAKENVERGTWSGIMDFIMACLAYSVGLANVWRFPFVFYKNGGGAFLVPLILCLIVVSTPLVFLEFSLGQFASLGPLAIWRVAPLFKGVGISTVIICALLSLYNAVSLSLSVFYMCASWQAQLPWQTCDNAWNSNECCDSVQYLENCTNSSNDDCLLCTSGSSTLQNITNTTGHWKTPAQEYFVGRVMDLSPTITSLGTPSWQLVLASLLVWTAVFLILLKGVRVFSKVVYVTGLVPCLLLLVLLIRVCLEDGASQGIAAFLRPDWSRLAHLQVWYDAVVQCVFSVGVCYGPLITLASYNNFSRNIARLSVLLPLLVILSALFMGVLVFAMYGALASSINTDIDQILRTGLSMSFTLWPQFTTSLPVPHLWVTLFYLCLLLLALDSQFISVHCICNALADECPVALTKGYRQVFLLLTLCVVLYLAGIVFVTQGGLYLYLVLYHYLTDITPLLLGAAECVLITWVYGFSHFGSNIWTMIGKHPSFFWRILWQGLTPLFLLLAVVYSIVAQKPLVYDDIELPWGGQVGSWVLSGLTLLSVPLYMIYILTKSQGTLKQRLRSLWRPSEDWGPAWETREMRRAWMTLPDYMASDKEEGADRRPSKGQDNEGFSDHSNGAVIAKEENSDSTVMSGEGYMENWFPGQSYTEDNIDTGSIQWSQDENKIRGNWAGRYDFLMSGLGYTIGIGNVWRFPYLVYKNGGGAFFLPYLLMLALCGFPLFFMELAFGQFASIGQLTIWKVSPLFKGIGYAMCTTTFLICSYYNVINAWSVLYLFASMTDTLPWTTCHNDWNTEMCHQRGYRECVYLNISEISTHQNTSLYREFVAECSRFENRSHYNTSSGDTEWGGEALNSSTVLLSERDWTNYTTPSEEYFFNYVLNLSAGIDELGTIQWHLSLCLLLCWLVTLVVGIRGVKSVGKVVYVTVVFPFIILLILLVRYATLEGSAYLDGIKFYVTPQWSQLGSASLWGDAASQMFFSLGLSIGGLIALGSFNRFHYDCYKDAYIIVIMDTLTSVFAGFVVFAILGVMANEAGTEVENVITAKFALAYIAFPEAVTKLPAAPLWSALFFLMLFTLAIDSQFLMVEGLVVAITDEFSSNRILKKRLYVILILCLSMYFLGLPMVSNGGLYIVSLMDTYSASWSPVVIGFMLCVVLAWVYKVDNFAANLKVMLGRDVGRIQRFMWKYITPLLLMFILVFSLVKYTPPTLDDYQYPEWAHILGILTGVSTAICIPIGALVQMLRSKHHIKEAVKKGCKPHIEWGPALDKHRANCYMPGVIDLNVKEWVEKGTYGHVFQTESSGHLDLLTELSGRDTGRARDHEEGDGGGDVETSEETPGGNMKPVYSFSSLNSEQGSVQEEGGRLSDIWEGDMQMKGQDMQMRERNMVMSGASDGEHIKTANVLKKDMLMKEVSCGEQVNTENRLKREAQYGEQMVNDRESLLMRESPDMEGLDTTNLLLREAQGGEQGKTDNRLIKREDDALYGDQGRNINNLSIGEMTGANLAHVIQREDNTGSNSVSEGEYQAKEEHISKTIASGDQNGQQIEEGNIPSSENPSEGNNEETVGCDTGESGTKGVKILDSCSRNRSFSESDRKHKDLEGTVNSPVKEVTFAADLHQEVDLAPVISEVNRPKADRETQTECSYIQDHLKR